MAELSQQQWYFTCVGHPVFELLGKCLEWLADFTGQRQSLQLGNQAIERLADLLDPRLAALLGVEHGFFQAWQQGGQGSVHLIGAHCFAHFLHALIDSPVGAFRRQGAAHQPTAQQIETGIPAALKRVLLFNTFEVFFFPVSCVVSHALGSMPGGLNTSCESTPTEPGKRISTATGRWSEIGWFSTCTRSRVRLGLSKI